jgi:phosphoribosylformylglycinamidine synthase
LLATFADDDPSKRPSVQVGDPFAEKLLIEASLELIERGLVAGLQDLGAAGLTSSSAEMAAKGGVGIDLDVRRVPLREADMEPFEIMISESQERMLCVVEPDRVDDVLAVCGKWEVNATAVGEVTGSGRLRVFDGDALVGDMPVTALVDECPAYDLEPLEAATPVYPAPDPVLVAGLDAGDTLLALLGSANLASRRWAFEQYDCIVGSRTVKRPEAADAAVLMLEHGGAIAVSIDGNGRRVAVDPYRGAVEAVLECSANLACVGAEPLGLTNCLNFGNPEKPHVAWQLTRAVEGMAAACRAFGVPVVGGNVSLYNEGPEGPIYPTPVVGMVGELPDAARAGGMAFGQAGDMVALVGPFAPSLTGSELARLEGRAGGRLEAFDLKKVREALEQVRVAVRSGALTSAHDVSDGGIACAVAESAIAGGIGADLDLAPLARRAGIDSRTALFGEGPGGILVSGPREALLELSGRAAGVGFLALGQVGGSTIDLAAPDARLYISVEDAGDLFDSVLANRVS